MAFGGFTNSEHNRYLSVRINAEDKTIEINHQIKQGRRWKINDIKLNITEINLILPYIDYLKRKTK